LGFQAIIRSDPGKSFSHISKDPRALILRPLSVDFNGGITRAQFPATMGIEDPFGV